MRVEYAYVYKIYIRTYINFYMYCIIGFIGLYLENTISGGNVSLVCCDRYRSRGSVEGQGRCSLYLLKLRMVFTHIYTWVFIYKHNNEVYGELTSVSDIEW